ncbi:family 43 glycosylhydrolase [Kribbella sp. NPDC049227]|uniref:family 43 glycosylhydrolase n=1 Tax=Kribbella sp. NPDC049227 TaxID=3364113 RepID=UPI0037122AAF
MRLPRLVLRAAATAAALVLAGTGSVVADVPALAATAVPCASRVGPGEYPNPLHECPAADPGIVVQGNTWYAFTTGLKQYRSRDAGHTWEDLGRFVEPPAGYVDFWAPEVYQIGGQWVAYFNMRTAPGQFNKIYVATSHNLEKGWQLNPTPLAGRPDYSMIDATMFQDVDGARYLIWKDDLQGTLTKRISIGRLSPDGLTRVGPATEIMHVTLPWEGNSVEGPSMLYRDGSYYLFYSGNLYTWNGNYAVGVARATSPMGNFDAGKHPTPMLRGDDRVASPGHQFITDVRIGGQQRQMIFYHGYPWYDADGNHLPSVQTRKLMMDELHWDAEGWPWVNDGTPSD